MVCAFVRQHWQEFLPAFVVCMLLVCSFIFFEVLDVDGSDFPPPSRGIASLASAEASHEIRRLPLEGVAPVAVSVVDTVLDRSGPPVRAQRAGLHQVETWGVVAPVRAVLTLARAFLAEPAA